jgi:hypothetical protein
MCQKNVLPPLTVPKKKSTRKQEERNVVKHIPGCDVTSQKSALLRFYAIFNFLTKYLKWHIHRIFRIAMKNWISCCGQEVFSTVNELSEECLGRATVQAEVWVRAWVRKCGIYGGQSGPRAGFHRVLPFALPIIPPTTPHSFIHSSSIIRCWYNRPIMADIPSELSLTSPQETRKKVKNALVLAVLIRRGKVGEHLCLRFWQTQ